VNETAFQPSESDATLNNLISSINWQDAFIKEVYLRNPTEAAGTDMIAYGAMPHALLWVVTPYDHQFDGVELAFYDVEHFNLPMRSELDPIGTLIVTQRVHFSLDGDTQPCNIRAERAAYRLLDRHGTAARSLPVIDNPFVTAV